MRAVFDTNVIVSALLFPDSKPGQAMTWAIRNAELLCSSTTLAELLSVLMRKKFDRYAGVETRIRTALAFGRLCTPVQVTETVKVCRDEEDNRMLELALSGKADILVTGDKDLLELGEFRGVRVIDATRFIEEYV